MSGSACACAGVFIVCYVGNKNSASFTKQFDSSQRDSFDVIEGGI